MMNDEVENELIERLKLGEERVFAEIYAQYFPMVKHYIKGLGGTKEDAQDVFSEGIMTLYQHIKRENFFLSTSFSNYLFKICELNWRKMQQKNQALMVNIEGLDFAEKENLFDEGDLVLLSQALDNIGAGCKQLLKCYISGDSMQEIADRLYDGNLSKTRSTLYRCRNKLRELILTYKKHH